MDRHPLSSSASVRTISANPHGDIAIARRYQHGLSPTIVGAIALTGAERENLRRWLNENAHPDAEAAIVRRT